MIEPPIDERYEITAVKQSLTTDERKLAEQAYTLLAHDYEANPIGSRDWVIFWTGWRNRAELSLATIENSHQPAVPAQPAAESTCTWSENDDGFYETECGNSFQFIDGCAADNHATYCQYCGKKIDEHWFDDMPEGDAK